MVIGLVIYKDVIRVMTLQSKWLQPSFYGAVSNQCTNRLSAKIIQNINMERNEGEKQDPVLSITYTTHFLHGLSAKRPTVFSI